MWKSLRWIELAFALAIILAGLGSLTTAQAAPPAPRPPAFLGTPTPTSGGEPEKPDTPHSDIWGTVTDLSTGQPARGVTVVINGAAVRTDAAGRFSLTGLPAGEYVISLADLPAGWQPAQARWEVWLDGVHAAEVALDCLSQPAATPPTPPVVLLPQTGGAVAPGWVLNGAGLALIFIGLIMTQLKEGKKMIKHFITHKRLFLVLAGLLLAALGLSALQALAAPPAMRPLVDPRPRREQVLQLTGGARPEPAGVSIQSTPPQTATWSVYDHYNFSDYNATFTLRYTSTYAYYYVDNAASVTTAILENVAAAFDANAITALGNFGNIPDVDGEPRVFVLLTDIRDEYTHDPGATTWVPCFFDPLHEHPGQPGSNGREMLYLDVNPTAPDAGEAGRCLTHQLALMVAYNYDPAEAVWADEGMATLAEFIAGYGHRPEAQDYLNQPNTPLLGWTGSRADIGKTYLWALYLRQRFGQSGVKQILQSQLHGLDPIQPLLGVSKQDLFHQWVLANYLDDLVQTGGMYGYAELNIVPAGGNGVSSFNRPPVYETVTIAAQEEKTISGSLAGYYAARYIALRRSSGSGLRVDDNSPDFGQSSLIGGAVKAANWAGSWRDGSLLPGQTVILAVGLSRESGSTTYRYNLGEYWLYYYFPIIFKEP